jgi:hypothetical protein
MISAVLTQPAGLLPQDFAADGGITVTSVNALAPIGMGRASLPQNAELAFSGPVRTEGFVIERVAMDRALIDLGDGYSLFVSDRDRQLVLENAASSSRTIIFGDARIKTASGENLQFWGTTTLAFGLDGKITLETAEAADQPGSFLLERIAVSNGTRAVVITGVADEAVDALTIERGDGFDVDYDTRDGFVLEQASDGTGWLTEFGDAATQDLLNETAVGGTYGPGSGVLSLSEFSSLISCYLSSMGSSSWHWSTHSRLNQDPQHDHHRQSSDRKNIERLMIEKLIFEQSFQRRHEAGVLRR